MRMIIAKCTECKKEFERAANSRACVCSPQCKRARKIRIQRESRKRLKTTGTNRCLHCGEEIPSRQKYCSKVECQRARKKANADASADRYAEIMRSEHARQCSECGMWFTKRSTMFVTCGREQCIKSRAKKVSAESTNRSNAKRAQERVATETRIAAQTSQEEIVRRIRGVQCPFVGEWTDSNGKKWPALSTPVSGYSSMDCPEFDPMTNRMEAGVWIETNEQAEVRAA